MEINIKQSYEGNTGRKIETPKEEENYNYLFNDMCKKFMVSVALNTDQYNMHLECVQVQNIRII